MSEGESRWPRVQEILAGIMNRWETNKGRKGLPGIHGFYWETPEELANDSSMGMKFIEPGVPAKETALVSSLRQGLGSIPKMPMGGPYLMEEDILEVERWIDSGMPG